MIISLVLAMCGAPKWYALAALRKFCQIVVLYVLFTGSTVHMSSGTSPNSTTEMIFDYETMIGHAQPKDSAAIFSDQWAMHVFGGDGEAKRLANLHGFDFVSKVTVTSIVLL